MACRVFLDLETTGLDPASGHILEIGVLAVSADAPAYAEVAAQSWVIKPDLGDKLWHDVLPPEVYNMHNSSGLLCEAAYKGIPLAEAEAGLLKFLAFFGNPAPGREPIGGFSAHFDLGWLAVHLPKVRAYFSHRVFDCSAFRQMAIDLGRKDLVPPPEQTAHRALADCRAAASMARAVAGLCKP